MYRRLAIALLAVTPFFSSSVFATISLIPCPAWKHPTSDYNADPGMAVKEGLDASSQIPEVCKPMKAAACTHPANDFTVFNCAAYYTNTEFCGSNPIYGQASGSGWPVAGNQIFKTSDGGVTYCAISYFDPWDPPKNRGDCPNCMGNPINVGTGNKFQRETDIASAGEGSLEFVRVFNSVGPYLSSGLGPQWTHSYSRYLFFRGASEIGAFRADGKRLLFTPTNGVWASDLDVPFQLVQSGTTWLLTTGDDEVETYDGGGRLLSIKSRSGKVTTLAYSDGSGSGPNGSLIDGTTQPLGPGLLIRVTDHKGRSLVLTYGGKARITKMTDPAGQIYLYGYTSGNAGILSTVLYPNSATRTYIYNESTNTSGANLPYALTGVSDENGARFATFKYATNGKAISTEHAGGVEKYQFTFSIGSTVVVDPLGTTHTSPVSGIANTAQVTATTRSCTGCGANTTETYTFDTSRNATSYKDFKGNLTCSTFQARNLETQRTEGLSGTGTCTSRVTTSATRTIAKEWHATWRIPKRIAEPLKITTFAYHGDTGVSCAPSGASTTLLCSKTVQATTDSDGSQTFNATSDGSPRTWSYTYNLAGQVLTVDGPRADVTDVTAYSYYTSDDSSGNYKTGDLASITNAKGQVTQFTQYDGAGRLKKMIDPNGLETLLAYSTRGWLTSRQVGSATAGYETTTHTYDNVGQLTRVTVPDASYVQYTYDDAHRLWKINDGLGNRIEYGVDNMGNRTTESAYDTGNTLVRAHSRVIDGLNRLWKDIGGTTPTTQIAQNGFDANGNVTSILDPLGRTTTQEYDALNRLTAVKDPFNGTSNPTSYQYNRQGILKQVTDPNGLSTTYTVNGAASNLAACSASSFGIG
jgi:YD repeat-containing protein